MYVCMYLLHELEEDRQQVLIDDIALEVIVKEIQLLHQNHLLPPIHANTGLVEQDTVQDVYSDIVLSAKQRRSVSLRLFLCAVANLNRERQRDTHAYTQTHNTSTVLTLKTYAVLGCVKYKHKEIAHLQYCGQ